MAHKVISMVVSFVLGIIILGAASFVSWTYWASEHLPPVKYLSVAILTRVVYPGDTLAGRTTFDRRRICRNTIDREINRLTDDTFTSDLIYSDTVPGLSAPIGEGLSIMWYMKLPVTPPSGRPWDPGVYVWSGINRLDCDGKVFTIPIPEASFRVCAPGDTHCMD